MPSSTRLNFYRSISGITGHPVKKNWSFIGEFLLAVGFYSPSANMLSRSQMAATKLFGIIKQKLLQK